MYRDHLLGVMGDRRHLGPDGRRLDPATRRFTEPEVVPQRDNRSYSTMQPGINAGEAHRYHNGAFGGRYGDELRLMVEGYVRFDRRCTRMIVHDLCSSCKLCSLFRVVAQVRHDTRWAAVGCQTPRVCEVIEPLMGADFRVVYVSHWPLWARGCFSSAMHSASLRHFCLFS